MEQAADYIVVGSGSAGGVVAARLSEDPRNRVLLLEAGGANGGRWTSVPLGFGKLLRNPANVWMHAGQPEAALDGRRITLLHGKILGGSSAVNGMVYVRGFPLDYAIWRQLGAEGWSYDEVLPYFRKAERYARGEGPKHGGDGPLGVERTGWQTPLADAFLASAQAIGLPRNDDLASADEGVGYHDLTTWRGQRSSTWHRYLGPVAKRPNLKIVSGAFVRNLIFEGKRAIGVVYERGGETFTAHADGEVILSAGALHSPQILQLSGIGPGPLLGAHGIPVVHDNAGVGANLMDHLAVTRAYRTGSRHTLNAMMARRTSMLAAGLDYYLRRKGPMTVGAAHAGGFAMTRPGLDSPDVQIGFSPMLPDMTSPTGLAPHSGFLLATYQLRPESRGHVRIASPDPHVTATVALNPLTTENDRATLFAGLRLLRRIAESAPLQAMGAIELSPDLAGLSEDSDAALAAHVARVGASAFHYSGTARIGSVVDPALRVIGVDGLRVIDASVMPTVTSGNTNAASIMIGEKGADLVRHSRMANAA